jgi:DNA-binding MarR family transcriptional regulator
VDEAAGTGGAALADGVVLSALRLAMGISIQAADEIGTLSTVQLRAVTVLSERPGANLGELAQGMAVSLSVTSRLVDRLVAAGLAERRPSPTSGREISLWLTPAGEQTLRRYDELRLAKVHERLRELPPERAREVVSALQALTAAVAGSVEASTGT